MRPRKALPKLGFGQRVGAVKIPNLIFAGVLLLASSAAAVMSARTCYAVIFRVPGQSWRPAELVAALGLLLLFSAALFSGGMALFHEWGGGVKIGREEKKTAEEMTPMRRHVFTRLEGEEPTPEALPGDSSWLIKGRDAIFSIHGFSSGFASFPAKVWFRAVIVAGKEVDRAPIEEMTWAEFKENAFRMIEK